MIVAPSHGNVTIFSDFQGRELLLECAEIKLAKHQAAESALVIANRKCHDQHFPVRHLTCQNAGKHQPGFGRKAQFPEVITFGKIADAADPIGRIQNFPRRIDDVQPIHPLDVDQSGRQASGDILMETRHRARLQRVGRKSGGQCRQIGVRSSQGFV